MAFQILDEKIRTKNSSANTTMKRALSGENAARLQFKNIAWPRLKGTQKKGGEEDGFNTIICIVNVCIVNSIELTD